MQKLVPKSPKLVQIWFKNGLKVPKMAKYGLLEQCVYKTSFLKNSQKSMQKLFLRAEKRVEKVVSIKVSNLILFGNGHPVCFA